MAADATFKWRQPPPVLTVGLFVSGSAILAFAAGLPLPVQPFAVTIGTNISVPRVGATAITRRAFPSRIFLVGFCGVIKASAAFAALEFGTWAGVALVVGSECLRRYGVAVSIGFRV